MLKYSRNRITHKIFKLKNRDFHIYPNLIVFILKTYSEEFDKIIFLIKINKTLNVGQGARRSAGELKEQFIGWEAGK